MTFFDKYSFRQKNYGLIVLAILLIAVSYKGAISITVEKYRYSQDLESKLIKSKTAVDVVKNKQLLIANLNRHLGEENNTIEQVQQEFLNFFAKKNTALKVQQIDDVLNYKHPDFEINTHKIILQGDFISSVRFIYELEQKFNSAKILNVSYKYEKVSNEDRFVLNTTILIQNFLR